MALSRYNATSGLLVSRHGKENLESGLVGKPGLKTRQGLAIISNTMHNTIDNAKKGLSDNSNSLKPSRVPLKQSNVSVDKENTVSTRARTKQEIQLEAVPEEKLVIKSPIKSLEDLVKELPNVQDIDKDDFENPQLVSEYVNNIYDYMRELERKFPIKARYLDGSSLNGRMRGILVDWLVQVHLRFHLLQETLYLTVAIIDRFLQIQKVARSKLQLVGVTAMLIASKYEEMYAPEIADFVYITDNAYTKADIRKTECIILKALDFNLGRPLPLHFLRRNSKAGEVDATKHTLAKYLMELTIVDYDMIHSHPSEIAAAALCLAMRVLEDAKWNDTLMFYSKYTQDQLRPIMARMALQITKAGTGKLTAIKTKYHSSKFMRISSIPELNSDVVKQLSQEAAASSSS